ncbi:hypothetical protein HFP15_07945 [Amycolatopsis sp. K13G38]|uniref:Uncharacterized protein n=1 Tax=Amycolatopsis acididurans TaxID=2724524 RepID=A0ABX1J094_9PSEU|nr:hypothetical protein [Amycolatopsis acididurans]NKQ52811.1 hypothetical protein [Amycolatopsis acididurans]
MIQQLRIRRITAYCLLGVCALTVVLIMFDLATPLRALVVLVLYTTAPGWALISYVNVRHVSVTWISAVALSISIGIVLAQMMVLTHAWHPESAVVGTAIATGALLAHHVVRSRPPSGAGAR